MDNAIKLESEIFADGAPIRQNMYNSHMPSSVEDPIYDLPPDDGLDYQLIEDSAGEFFSS